MTEKAYLLIFLKDW